MLRRPKGSLMLYSVLIIALLIYEVTYPAEPLHETVASQRRNSCGVWQHWGDIYYDMLSNVQAESSCSRCFHDQAS